MDIESLKIVFSQESTWNTVKRYTALQYSYNFSSVIFKAFFLFEVICIFLLVRFCDEDLWIIYVYGCFSEVASRFSKQIWEKVFCFSPFQSNI